MLPHQHLTFDIKDTPVAVDVESNRFGMIGFSRPQQAASTGIEVHVQSRSTVGASTQLQVVGGRRRFTLPGFLQFETTPPDERGRPRIIASVAWTSDDDEHPTQEELRLSASLGPLVDAWLGLVRASRERQPGQMDLILGHLGPMPPVHELTNRALWVCALINPLPSLGVAYEVRPAALKAQSAKERLELACEGVGRSIANLNGEWPL